MVLPDEGRLSGRGGGDLYDNMRAVTCACQAEALCPGLRRTWTFMPGSAKQPGPGAKAAEQLISVLVMRALV